MGVRYTITKDWGESFRSASRKMCGQYCPGGTPIGESIVVIHRLALQQLHLLLESLNPRAVAGLVLVVLIQTTDSLTWDKVKRFILCCKKVFIAFVLSVILL